MVKRHSLIVYYKQENALNVLDGIANIVHKSKRFRYAVVYIDAKRVNEVKKKLNGAKGIKDVIDSEFSLENFSFDVK